MPNTHLYLAPAAAGKTAYVLRRVRAAARGLRTAPLVCVPTGLQVRSFRRRLAQDGGAIGVRVLTFDGLYQECLDAAGEAYVELSEPVQYRLIRAVLDSLGLVHYRPLVDRPGFVQALQDIIGELKAAQIWPEDFARAAADMGNEPRLTELARIYSAYQDRLTEQRWADRAGLGWLAVESLTRPAPAAGCAWPLLAVDGFDNFAPVQLAVLRALAPRTGEMIITLTGSAPCAERAPLHQRRFDQTRRSLEDVLGIAAEPLPQVAPPVTASEDRSPRSVALAHLEAGLFRTGRIRVPGGDEVHMIEAPDRAGEVRAALRWLKERLVADGMRPADLALLGRSMTPYRAFVLEAAREFGLPVRLATGLPLKQNPAIAALFGLLRLVLPAGGNMGPFALPWRQLVETWRSPYFDWPDLFTPEDAEALDTVARWGQVVGGYAQWEETLSRLASRSPDATEADEERGLPSHVPAGADAAALLDKLRRFVQAIAPPEGRYCYRDFVRWLEALIGPDPAAPPSRHGPAGVSPGESPSLRMVACARRPPREIAERDVAALQALKEVLRGLVWAEEAVGDCQIIAYERFFDELMGATEAAVYHPQGPREDDDILVADVIQARGIPFRAVAVVGLAEGEFPTSLNEDPFLRDADRTELSQRIGQRLPIPTDSAEHEFFYETVTRPRERLLLCRPRLADNGAPWQSSPYWEEVRRLVDVNPVRLSGETIPLPTEAASWPELLMGLASYDGCEALRDLAPMRWFRLDESARLLRLRRGRPIDSPFEGHLGALAGEMGAAFGPAHIWSASRLESYRSCPYHFFVSRVLGLEPRSEPVEGLNVQQLGTIYHRIFEKVYKSPAVTDPSDLRSAPGGTADGRPGRSGRGASARRVPGDGMVGADTQGDRRQHRALARRPGRAGPQLPATGVRSRVWFGRRRSAQADRWKRLHPAPRAHRPGRPVAGRPDTHHRLQVRRLKRLHAQGRQGRQEAPTPPLRSGSPRRARAGQTGRGLLLAHRGGRAEQVLPERV